jgi:hypothetical protein
MMRIVVPWPTNRTFVPLLPAIRIVPETLSEESIVIVVGVLTSTDPPYVEDETFPDMVKVPEEPVSEAVALKAV